MWKDCFVPNAILRKIWETTRNLGTHPAWLLETTISKICHFPTRLSPSKTQNFVIVAIYQLATWNFFRLVIQLMFFFETGRNCSIIITIIGSITVLLSDNVICFGYFMPMSHGVNKKAPTNVSPPPLPPTRFSPVLFVVLQERLYQPVSSYLTDYCKKKMHFQSKTKFFLQFIAGRF